MINKRLTRIALDGHEKWHGAYRVDSFQARSAAWVPTFVYEFMFCWDRISNARGNQVFSWAELGDKIISPVASFVLGTHFTNSYLRDSRCPFGLIDNPKHMRGRFRSHFQKMSWRGDLKRASRPFDCCKLNLIGHRWPKVMAIWKFTFQSDSYVHIRIALIYNTFLVIARAYRPSKQREAKLSTHLALSWHT